MATKKAPAKKTTAKRAPAKARSSTKVTKAKAPEVRSFRPSPRTEPFFTFRISHQTAYWVILAGAVLILGLWVMTLTIQVQRIYDQIDTTIAALME